MISYPFTSKVTYDSTGQPIFDRAVDSDFLRKFYRKDRSNGVIALGDSSAFLTVANSGMSVKVKPGYCFINGAYGVEQSERELILQAASTVDRIDTIVLRLNDSMDVRAIDLYVVKGTPATTPSAPTLTRSGSVYEIGIANIYVTANSSVVTQERITDTRLDSNRCGYSLPLQSIDTTNLYLQLQDQIESNMDLIQSAIDDTTAGLLQNEITKQSKADGVSYDNSTSGLSATNVQSAIDELNVNKASKSVATTSTNGLMSSTDKTKLNGILGLVYPVGAIYMSVSSASPTTLFGGTWTQIKDRFLLCAGSSYGAGSTGGEANHTLTINEIPSHAHSYKSPIVQQVQSVQTGATYGNFNKEYDMNTSSVGGGESHNNMPPYLAVYVWKRTA